MDNTSNRFLNEFKYIIVLLITSIILYLGIVSIFDGLFSEISFKRYLDINSSYEQMREFKGIKDKEKFINMYIDISSDGTITNYEYLKLQDLYSDLLLDYVKSK